jgi:hypothetical protein
LIVRFLLYLTIVLSIFYLTTGLVYEEGGFNGVLVIKPRPTHVVSFGGGEAGTWARHHHGKATPWFMRRNLLVVSTFSWEEGVPGWITAYYCGYLVTILMWVCLSVCGLFRLATFVRRNAAPR